MDTLLGLFILFLCVLNSAGLIVLFIILTRYLRIEWDRQRLINPTQDLHDFLTDIKIHGYGVLRLDPDNLMLRSPR